MLLDGRPRFDFCELCPQNAFRYFGVMCRLGAQPVTVGKTEKATQAMWFISEERQRSRCPPAAAPRRAAGF